MCCRIFFNPFAYPKNIHLPSVHSVLVFFFFFSRLSSVSLPISFQFVFFVFIHLYIDFFSFLFQRRYFRSPIALITHLDKIHKNQHFQCNCCSYRAITADHVNLHQLFCHQNVCQENRCIYQKTPPQNSSLKLKYFYDKYRIEHIAENRYRYQCLYCKYCSNIFQETIQHLVRLHPEFPLLYYDNSDDDDQIIIMAIVNDNHSNNNTVCGNKRLKILSSSSSFEP